jgi:hypothetical protein
METYIDKTDEGLVTQAGTFFANIDALTGPCNLDPAKVSQAKIAITYFLWTYLVMNLAHAFSKAWTEFKDLIKGVKDGTKIVAAPVMGTIPTMPTVPNKPDLRLQLLDLIKDAKRSDNFTTDAARSIAVLLVPVPFNPEEGKPIFSVEFVSGGHPLLKWFKGLYQGVEVWKDSGDGKWVRIDKTFSPDYTDMSALPAAGVSAVWKYKLIYLYKDAVVGSYSVEITVTVMGAV